MMSDQCKYCTLKGDIDKCKAAECFHHENWYAVEQQKIIDDLESRLVDAKMVFIDLKASLRTCANTSNSMLAQYSDVDI